MLNYPITANPKKPKKNNLIIVTTNEQKYVGLVTDSKTEIISRYAFHRPPGVSSYVCEKKSKKMPNVGAFYRTSEYIQVTWTGNAPKIKHKVDKDGCLWYCWGVDGDWVIIA